MNGALARDLTTRRFWRRFLVSAFAAVGALVTLLEAVDLFVKGDVGSGVPWLFAVFVITAIAFGFWRAWPRPIEETFVTPGTSVRIVHGDLLEERGHIVVGTCDTFDTEPPHISKESLQGQFLDRIYGGDVVRLNADLDEALGGIEPLGVISKPGKSARYELGTVATIQGEARKYFLVAYTEMNARNEARATIDGLWQSLSSLWGEVRAQSNGGSVSVPVVGGGQSRISQLLPTQDSIRFMILSFMLASRREKVCDELRIVVREADFERLDRLELQAFLSSLKPS